MAEHCEPVRLILDEDFSEQLRAAVVRAVAAFRALDEQEES